MEDADFFRFQASLFLSHTISTQDVHFYYVSTTKVNRDLILMSEILWFSMYMVNNVYKILNLQKMYLVFNKCDNKLI